MQRRATMRTNWRDWIGLLVMAAFATVGAIVLSGFLSLLAAWMLGFVTAILLFGWKLGFDVHSLTWLWGAWGEEETGDELAKLDRDWFVIHDIPSSHGNWDHVVVGPGGLFLLDTKRLTNPATVSNDALTSGRTRYEGRTFRGAAIGLREALQAKDGNCPWINTVVVVWGEFAQDVCEEERVTYVSGDKLIQWLTSQQTSLSRYQAESLRLALTQLAAT